MSYQDDHNLQPSVSQTSLQDSRRQHQTLSSAIDAFITSTVDVNGQPVTGRDIFNHALRMMSVEEGSEVVREFLASLDAMGDPSLNKGGVSDEFLLSLERIDVSKLADGAECAICTNRFVDNDYPLVVSLPCHVQGGVKKDHMFDLDCIAPWLKVHPTCPMCRFNVHDVDKLKRQRLAEELADEEEDEEDDWDVYG